VSSNSGMDGNSDRNHTDPHRSTVAQSSVVCAHLGSAEDHNIYNTVVEFFNLFNNTNDDNNNDNNKNINNNNDNDNNGVGGDDHSAEKAGRQPAVPVYSAQRPWRKTPA